MKKKGMNILVAPNSMKGSLTAFDFADIVEKAFLEVSGKFSVKKIPVADGGDLTGEILRRALDAESFIVEVKDPLGRNISAKYAVSGNTAIIEMADASGIKLLKSNELNPMKTSSFGTGQLLKHVIEHGCTEVLLGVGGSATVDGGTGMLKALGFELLDKNGNILQGNGENLQDVSEIRKPENPHNVSVKIISDVDNPLLGEEGAAAVFGPQKGATPAMTNFLEKGLSNWEKVLETTSGKLLANIKGAGAAGGIALPLLAFFDAEIVPGASFVLTKLNVEKEMEWADLVITGEGKIDSQTLHNKAPMAVASMARKAGKPVMAIGGKTEKTASSAFDGIYSFVPGPISLDNSIDKAGELLFDFATELARTLNALFF
jgi:glycerate 2-kinase